MTRNILVTGGAGYIGSHACKQFALNGYTPVTFDNLQRGSRAAVKWGPLVVGDLLRPKEIRQAIRAFQVEAVVHFAAFAYVGESIADPGLYFRNNINGTVNLLDAMIETGVKKIVFSSTCAVYGIPEELPITEESRIAPINPYGESKLCIEKMLAWYGKAHGLNWTALRYFNAAGADRDGEIGENHDPETHLIPLAIQAARGEAPPLKILGTDYPTPDGTAIRDFIHVTDLADAHLRALDYLGRGGASTALNLGTGTGYSVLEIIHEISRKAGRDVPTIKAQRREGDPPILVANTENAARLLGWRPCNSDLATIIATAIHWEQSKHLLLAAE